MEYNTKLIDRIYQYSKNYGNLFYECENLIDTNPILVINTFFYTIENVIKSLNEDFDASFNRNIEMQKNNLTVEEIEFLHSIRDIRNIFAHDNLDSQMIVIDEIAYILSDSDTSIVIYKNMSNIAYKILVKLIEINN